MNPSNPHIHAETPDRKIKGKTKAKYTMIAALIARGFLVKDVARKVKLSDDRISHLLSDKDSFVNAEIKRILNELFASADRRLINLYNKALQKLDTMLSSSDEEKQYRAMDRIIKMFFARIPKNTIIQQYFGDQQQPQRELTIDDYILFSNKLNEMILEKRKERELDKLPDDEDSSDSSLDNSSPEVSSPEVSSPNHSSQKSIKEFVDSIGFDH